MNSSELSVKIAVLDDYQGVALKLADWSAVRRRAGVDVFSDHLSDTDAIVERLLPYDEAEAVLAMAREFAARELAQRAASD